MTRYLWVNEYGGSRITEEPPTQDELDSLMETNMLIFRIEEGEIFRYEDEWELVTNEFPPIS